jgi:quercetin dioxygenase-like cupin family protein
VPYVAPHEVLDAWSASIDTVVEVHGEAPWRQPLLANDDVRVALICWPPGFRTIPHQHPHATETFQVVSGHLGFRLDDRPELALGAGDIAIAHRGQVHGLWVSGDSPLVFIASVSPNQDRPDEQIDVPDRWPDWQPGDASAGGSQMRVATR